VRGGGREKLYGLDGNSFEPRGSLRVNTVSRMCNIHGIINLLSFCVFLAPKTLVTSYRSSFLINHVTQGILPRERDRQSEREGLEIVLGGGEGRVVYCSQLHLNQLLQGNSLDSCLRYVGTQLRLQFQTSINLHSR